MTPQARAVDLNKIMLSCYLELAISVPFGDISMVDINRGENIGPTRTKLPTRRSFLTSTAAVGVAAATGGLWLPSKTLANTVHLGPSRPVWKLRAVRVEKTFDDGTTVPMFRYQSIKGAISNGEQPLLIAKQNSRVKLIITNTLDFAIQPMVVGGSIGPIIKPGNTRRMWVKIPKAGSYMLTEALLGPAAGPVGFGAMILSRGVRSRDPLPDCEYVLLYQDIDDRWNFDVDAGLEPDISTYEPNFHTVNGLTFPDLAGDHDSRLVCQVGDNVALRLGNLGHVRQAIHFHGYHVNIKSINNVPNTMLPMKDTVELPGYGTTDILMPINQPGVYPVHPHSLTTVTANGLYPYGQIVLIDAT